MEKNSCIKVGAWGGSGGKRWNDGTYGGVREIKLVYAKCIDSIFVIYDQQNQPFKRKKHGAHGGVYTAQIKLHYPDEFPFGVSGHYGLWRSYVCIRSLTFNSNRRTFGPYGVEEGKRFTFSSYPFYEIVGFHGSSGEFLDSIGLHLSQAKRRTFAYKTKDLASKGA
ncbi:jacalin-related lectin 19-like [Lotus japonicus]|uniref:jacalin-related lectin 19-like n=1 Tax=Lotus japonicus TaxID=34305 RepID=UPI0025856463|nr:jacalin-related lectin 19-like [Lotus japonicus]